MRFVATRLPILLAASATIVASQDVTSTGSDVTSTGGSVKCAAQNVVDQCVQNMKFQLENCATYDWDCQCIGSTNVVNCYNNCPEHPDRIGAQTIRQQNCANAKAYDTTTTLSHPTSTAVFSASLSSYASSSTGTPSGLKSNNHNDDSNSSSGEGNSESSSSEPTKSLTGLEASSSPSQGAAAGAIKTAGGWVAFLGLALGVLF